MSDLTYEEIHDALLEARSRITDYKRWITGEYVIRDGADAEPCYCAVGAICEGKPAYVTHNLGLRSIDWRRQFQVMEFFAKNAGIKTLADVEEGIAIWNDSDTSTEHHTEVLAAFDRAILAALVLLLDEWVCTWEALARPALGLVCLVCGREAYHPSHRPAGRPWQCPLGLTIGQADDIRHWRGEVRS